MNPDAGYLSDTAALRPLVRRAVELGRGPAALVAWLDRRRAIDHIRADSLARELAKAVAATPPPAGATVVAVDETYAPEVRP